MAKLKDQLTSEVAGIILRHVRTPKGRLTEISDDSKINRKDFNVHGLSQSMHPTPFGENLLAPTNAGVLSIPKKRG